jgi:hypothetical protein
MLTNHAEIRAKQRGISVDIIELLRVHGDVKPAPGGSLIRYFGKRSKRFIEAELGERFIAKDHEKLRSYLIESRESDEIITGGKLYSNQRLTKSKVNRL